MAYGLLARYYDGLMAHADYEALADYILPFVGERRRVLDLACGTGRFTEILCRRGYDVTAVDASEDMLTQAVAKGTNALFLCQKAEELDLFGTVEAALCTMDSVNYLTEPSSLLKTLAAVYLFLEPDGLFVFDVHHPDALRAKDGRSYSSECEDAYCVWDCHLDGDLCRQRLTLFYKTGDRAWRRHREWHNERAYTIDELKTSVKSVGFTDVKVFGMYTKRPPQQGDERLLFVCQK